MTIEQELAPVAIQHLSFKTVNATSKSLHPPKQILIAKPISVTAVENATKDTSFPPMVSAQSETCSVEPPTALVTA